MTTRRWTAVIGSSVAAGALLAGTVGTWQAPTAAAAEGEVVSVDFSQTTGEFRGGASGSLYGLADPGVPSQAVLNGAHVTNVSQKPPDGAQHPNGDALAVEDSFFAGAGEDLYVYTQDAYPDWPYHEGTRPGDEDGDGVWDYLPLLREAVTKVAENSDHPEEYIIIPFNEPDGVNWYSDWTNQKDEFLADWSAAYEVIQEVYAAHGLGQAQVGGPGISWWQPDWVRDFLSYADEHDQLPDIFIWHELGTQNLATFRSHMDAYRELVADLGIPEIPVNITEYAMPRDMGVPGQMIQWLAMFEDEKVDAQTAYWNYAGNLSDNASRNNSGNGGWWMLKWYGDLVGSTTVELTPPQLNEVDSLQGIAAIEADERKATVLVGGGDQDIHLDLSGLDPQVFGTTVDVVVREDRINGAEGDSLQPPVVQSKQLAVTDGQLELTIPNDDRYSAYQVQITPPLAQQQQVDDSLVSSVEAEDAQLQEACAVFQDPSEEWSHLASGSKDVGCVNKPGSSLTWDVTVPHDGRYRLDVLGATNQAAGKQALFVDGDLNQVLDYAANLGWTYRGSTNAWVELDAGAHTFSLRPSTDGENLLPGSDITADRFDLYDVTDGEFARYSSVGARLSAGADLSYEDPATAGSVQLQGEAQATYYAAVAETGYYDVTVNYQTEASSAVVLSTAGRSIEFPASDGAGKWESTARVFLPEGINEFRVSAPQGALVSGLSTLRDAEQRAADSQDENVVRHEGSDLTLTGTATLADLPANSNGTGGKAIEKLGKGSTAVMPRPEGFGPGEYQVVLSAANAAKADSINYNAQVINRFVNLTEEGGSSARAAVRHNYAWNSFWNFTVPMSLQTEEGAITLGNPDDWAPHINAVTLARFVAGEPTTSGTGPAVTAVAAGRCVAGDAVVAVSIGNGGDSSVAATLRSEFATGSVDEVPAGETVTRVLSSRTPQLPAGEVAVHVTGAAGSEQETTAPYPALSCS